MPPCSPSSVRNGSMGEAVKAARSDLWPYDPHNMRWVAREWAKGKDTARIAQTTALTEAQVYNILARLQDERHALRTGGAA